MLRGLSPKFHKISQKRKIKKGKSKKGIENENRISNIVFLALLSYRGGASPPWTPLS